MWLTSANLQYQTLGFKSFVVHTTTMERFNNKKQKKVVKVRQLDITQKIVSEKLTLANSAKIV